MTISFQRYKNDRQLLKRLEFVDENNVLYKINKTAKNYNVISMIIRKTGKIR